MGGHGAENGEGDRYGVERKKVVDSCEERTEGCQALEMDGCLRVAFHRGIHRATQKSSMNVGVAPTRQAPAT